MCLIPYHTIALWFSIHWAYFSTKTRIWFMLSARRTVPTVDNNTVYLLSLVKNFIVIVMRLEFMQNIRFQIGTSFSVSHHFLLLFAFFFLFVFFIFFHFFFVFFIFLSVKILILRLLPFFYVFTKWNRFSFMHRNWFTYNRILQSFPIRFWNELIWEKLWIFDGSSNNYFHYKPVISILNRNKSSILTQHSCQPIKRCHFQN